MEILVTGGAGYIGSHVVKSLSTKGFEVVIVDNLSTGHRAAVKGYQLLEGDIRDSEFLKGVFTAHKVKAVIHFAASSLVGESQKDPEKYYFNNILGTLNLLQVMREFQVPNIVFSSSAAVYGEPVASPITEKILTKPINVYGRTKLMIEEILADYHRAYGFNYIALRYFNACGADPAGSIGEDHRPETHLIPVILQAALGQREKLVIYGQDYDTPDGTCIRDYIHVNDLAEAHILAVSHLLKEKESGVYNLGYGKGFSVWEIVKAVQKVTGRDFKIEIGSRRPGDPAVLVADPELIEKELGWIPRYNDLEYIIKTAWQWHSHHLQGYGY